MQHGAGEILVQEFYRANSDRNQQQGLDQLEQPDEN